ncbi:MAG TPA: translocation/assembly module TamB domain-containing protein [Devosia sp.]|jgi:translocation and assembly module TamB|uniref:translocation/assembly module TamB domain-containing protein n=1 Tax=Devosia sp. TaxID=1871048 RepID=UPI002F9361EA
MRALLSFYRHLAVLFLFLVAAALPVAAQDVLAMDNEEQKDWLTTFVQDRLSTPERQIRLSNIDGVLGSNVSIREITISDAEGVWLQVNNATLTWNQAALFLGRLEVQSLKADSIDFIRNARPVEGAVDLPPPEAGSFQVPEFPVAVILQQLSVPSVTFGEDVFGLASQVSLAGDLTLEGGNLDTSLDIVRLDGPGGTLDLDVVYSNAESNIDLGLSLVEPENGLLANLLNIEGRPAVTLNLSGSGPITDLRTELELQANGQTALAGVATINRQAEGTAVALDLGGPLATLLAEPYRPFFGAETTLAADALLRAEGGLSITGLRLSGGQLSLQAAAETTPDNFLRQLTLEAVVADPSGEKVILPVPGSATRVSSARLDVAFGQTGEEWSSNLAVTGYETEGFAADTLAMTLGGVAANLSDPATRRVTFNGDGTLSGIAGSAEIEAALGDSIGLGIAGMWTAGEPVQLAELRVVGQALTVALAGQLDNLDFTGDITVDTASIAPFSGLAGRELDGALALRINGTLMPLTGGFDVTLDGTGTDLSVGDEVADRLLAGTVALTGRVARTEAGLLAENFRVGNQQLSILADGTYSSEVADFDFNLDLSDLALLSDQASGALSVTGTATGTAEAGIDLVLDAEVPQGRLADRDLVNGRFGFDGRYAEDALRGQVSGQADIEGHRATLAAGIGIVDDQQVLSDLRFQAAGTEITGNATRNAVSGLIDGQLALRSPDIAIAAALALLDAQGAVDIDIALEAVGSEPDFVQGARLAGDVQNLVVNGLSVGAADLQATITDLFGVPAIEGRAEASDVAVAGVTIRTLSAEASQSGSTTSFAARAALAIGTDVDVAGSLAPVEDGYRLALDRAELQQGELAARLAQPTVLQIAGSSVALDAVRFDVGSGSITANGSTGETLNIVLDVNALPLSIANAVVPSLGLAGMLDGRVNIAGTGSDPQVSFDAQVGGVDAEAISGFGIARLSASASGTFSQGTVSLATLRASGSGGLTVSGSGTIPLSGDGLNLALEGSAPLALANRFVAARGSQFSGVLNLDARVTGSLGQPQFGGRVSTSGAGYVDPELNLRLAGITGSASLNGQNLVIDTLSAGLSTGGSVSASGSVGLTANLPANIRLALDSARYADGDLFVATVDGNLALTGNLTGSPLLAGDVFVEEANITVPESFGGGAQLIDVEHVHTPPAVEQTLQRAKIDDATGAPIPQTRPAGVLLDVNVNAPNQIFIRGRGLDAEVGGSVRLTGPVNNIQPVGAFSLIRGRLAILGQRVTFQSGLVTLVGDLDPVLNLVAETQGDDITVYVTVSGRASDIDVSFTSSPQLPQDEVLSRLIFKRSMGELSPLQLARLAGAAAELVGGGGGGGGLVDSLRGAAGLDDLDVVTDEQGNVAVQAGTYIQDNVYLGVQAGAGGQSRVTINLDVTDDLKVTGAAGQDGNSSLGVFYEKDY